MNIQNMKLAQAELDEKIFKANNIKKYPYNNILLAFKVEICEVLQEYQIWKYWKKDKNINKQNLLLKLADAMHFALSLENRLYKFNSYEYINDYKSEILDPDTFVRLANKCLSTYNFIDNVVKLSLACGFTQDELEKAYYEKRKINLIRVKEGY